LYSFQKLWDDMKDSGDFFYQPFVVLKHTEKALGKLAESPAHDMLGLSKMWVSNSFKQFFNELSYCMSIFERIGNLLHPLKDTELTQESKQLDKVHIARCCHSMNIFLV
jgi:hypothetical protein